MTTLTTDHTLAVPARPRGVRLVSLFGGLAGGGAGLALLFANPLTGETSSDITRALEDSAALLQGIAIAGVYGGAALLVAAAALGRHVGGFRGRLLATSGAAVAVMLVAYLASYGGGALVASLVLDSPGPGVAEATLVGANIAEIVRYAPSLVLVVTAVVARAALPRAVTFTAGALAVLVVVPFTSWFAAILVPLWLGVAAAVTQDRSEARSGA